MGVAPEKRARMTVLDRKLIIGLALLAGGLFCLRFWPAPASELTARVELAGKPIREIDLKDYDEKNITVKFPQGQVKLAVKAGAVCVRQVLPPKLNPRKICIKMGWIRRPGELIICVPARLVVRLVGPAAASLDAIAR
ncbi:MAG: NusG domain II-containing protein [Bacillota bacterium]